MSKKLALIAEARKRKQNQKEMSDSLLSIIRSAVEENIVHGRDGKDGKDGETKIIHEYEPLPEDVVKRDEVITIKQTIDQLYSQSGSLSDKQLALLQLLSDKVDILMSVESKQEPVSYSFNIVRDNYGRIVEVVATPSQDTD